MSSRKLTAANSLPSVSDRFAGFGQPRAFACVIREGDPPQLLVFDHPMEGTQIPKGRIDPGESPRGAAVRELTEESGLELEPTRFIGHLRQRFEHPAGGETVEEDWYVWLFDAPAEMPESWIHIPEEEALRFPYRWLPLDACASTVVHTYFRDVLEMTIASTSRIEQMFGDDKPDG